MFSFLLKKEIAAQIISARFAVMLVLILVITAASAQVMVRDWQMRMENYEQLRPKASDTIAIKAPLPASILVKGLDERSGRSMTVNSSGMIEVGSSQSSVLRLVSLFSQIDLHFIISILMSLAAMLFAFDLVSGEKYTGTLKLMLANGVARSTIVTAKALAAWVLVAIPLALALLVNLVFIAFLAPTAFTGDLLARVPVLVLASLLYLAVFVLLGLLISALTLRPSTSLVLGLLVWAVLVFVLPNASSLAARNQAGGASLDLSEYRVRETWTKEIFRMNQLPPEQRDWSTLTPTLAGGLGAIHREYLNQAARQVDLLGSLSILSPLGPYNFLAWGAAGTGPVDALHYKNAVLRYQGQAIDDAVALLQIRRGPNPEQEQNFRAQQFTYAPRTLEDLLAGELLPNAASLVIMLALLYALAAISFNRYDVR
jgi:ABC-type transport system involved in multi-copper enzyme maturation permease subunit